MLWHHGTAHCRRIHVMKYGVSSLNQKQIINHFPKIVKNANEQFKTEGNFFRWRVLLWLNGYLRVGQLIRHKGFRTRTTRKPTMTWLFTNFQSTSAFLCSSVLRIRQVSPNVNPICSQKWKGLWMEGIYNR